MISSRSLADLLPHVAGLAQAFLEQCTAAGIDLIIYSTYRDKEAQDALYAQGRTAPGHIVTNAKGGESYHNWRVAFDAVPIVNGKLVWNSTDPVWQKVGVIARSVGLECGMDWKKFRDVDHFQATGGLTIAQFQQGQVPVYDQQEIDL